MSKNKFCLNCGNSSFVSDRSLGGKLICVKCGSSSIRYKSSFSIKNKSIIYLFIGILILIIII